MQKVFNILHKNDHFYARVSMEKRRENACVVESVEVNTFGERVRFHGGREIPSRRRCAFRLGRIVKHFYEARKRGSCRRTL